MQSLINIRMSGLEGQGVVTAAHILGSAANAHGYESTVNPFFGAEKRLAPAESYVRISNERINERGEILSPHIIMIFHPHVISMGKCYTMPFYEGLQENGAILINSDEIIDFKRHEKEQLQNLNVSVYYIPATKIASEVGGTELSTNIAMLGGLLGINSIVGKEQIEAALAERFSEKKFVASATTAVLDDAVKSKYNRVAQLIEKNMDVVDSAMVSVQKCRL